MKKLNNLTHTFIFFALFSALLTSCGTEEDYGDATLSITLSSQSVSVGNSITFTATSSISGDVSNEAIFTVNGQQISGNTFTPTEVSASNEVFATYNGLTSSVSKFSSTDVVPSAFTQKVLVEDYTGTWCQYCPKMSLILDYFTQYSDRIIPIAIHSGEGSAMNDPWAYEHVQTMTNINNYNAIGLPKGKINRIYGVNQLPYTCPVSNQALYTAQLDPYLNQSASLGLAINSTLSGNNLNIQVRVGFADTNIPQDARLVVTLIEEGLKHDQINAYAGTSFADCIFNQGAYNVNPISNFPQKHVLLKAYTDIFGDIIPHDQIFDGVYSKNFEVTLPNHVGYPSGTAIPENLKIVAFVLGNGTEIKDRAVINTQSAWVNTNQDFD